MTDRDFAFWLQGFFELQALREDPIEFDTIDAWAGAIRKHADLALLSVPASGFILACRSVADQPDALRAIVASQFEHVIDPTMPPIEKDPAHKPTAHLSTAGRPDFAMRC